ncbi:hypothetical protein SAMN05216302_10461 [Nitrosomonas aestuarii]|uniref:Uncharacterized protein n=2 Tax=Nitrosomonas aestuarii TaxID=52441 RepID=A0A1I4G3M2_9PROT|nr:hypothetical protein SAMN05216302_10461 [Nitrosomonas aestuarii]
MCYAGLRKISENHEMGPRNRKKHNAMACAIAHTPGFGALRNKEQRLEFSREVMASFGEDITNKKYYGVIHTAECIYEFGVLPIRVNELLDSCESTKEIAKLLGHTKLRIERALDCRPDGIIKQIIDENKKILINFERRQRYSN